MRYFALNCVPVNRSRPAIPEPKFLKIPDLNSLSIPLSPCDIDIGEKSPKEVCHRSFKAGLFFRINHSTAYPACLWRFYWEGKGCSGSRQPGGCDCWEGGYQGLNGWKAKVKNQPVFSECFCPECAIIQWIVLPLPKVSNLSSARDAFPMIQAFVYYVIRLTV